MASRLPVWIPIRLAYQPSISLSVIPFWLQNSHGPCSRTTTDRITSQSLSASLPRGVLSRPKRWCTRRADWEAFTRECLAHLTPEVDDYDDFIVSLTQICDSTIPKSSGRPRKHNPWFSEECRVALREKRKSIQESDEIPYSGEFHPL